MRPNRLPMALLLTGLLGTLLLLMAASTARGAVSIPLAECGRILWHHAGFPVAAAIDP